MKAFWRQKTNTGRVVYDRPKNTKWTPKSMASIVKQVCTTITPSPELFEQYGISINFTHEILSKTLYAGLKNYIAQKKWNKLATVIGIPIGRILADIRSTIERELRETAKTMAREAAAALMKKFKVPDEFTNLFIDLVFDIMWDWIDGTLGAFIRGLK